MKTSNEQLLDLAERINSLGVLDGEIRRNVLQMITILRPEVEKERKREFERQESLAREREFNRRERLTRDGWEYGQRARGEI